MSYRDTGVIHPESPEERALRWAMEDAAADLAWEEFEQAGGAANAASGHEAAQRYRDELERIGAKVGVTYGSRSG